MENKNRIKQLKLKLEKIKINSSQNSIIKRDLIKYKIFKTNTNDISKPNNNKNININKNPKNKKKIKIIFIKLAKIFEILKNRLCENKYIFETLKLYINNKRDKRAIRNNLLSFELKKEIFLDKFNTNRKKEEYYNKCNIINSKGTDNDLRNKLFNEDIKYISITHNIMTDNNQSTSHKKYYKNLINNFNNKSAMGLNNQSQIQTINVSHLRNLEIWKNKLIKKNVISDFYPNRIKIKILKTKTKNKNKVMDPKNINNSLKSANCKYSKKKINSILKNTNEINLKVFQSRISNEEGKLISTSSPYSSNKELREKIFKDENITSNNKYSGYHKNINNIFLSDLPDSLEEYQSDTYNPKNNYNQFSNYLEHNFNINKIRNNNNINVTDRKVYKKFNNFNFHRENLNSSDELNKGKFKEIIINYNNKNYSQSSFDRLKKNLRREFNNKNKIKRINKLYLTNERNERDNIGKLSNKNFITYNNIININEPYLMQTTLKKKKIKQNENNTTKIESYIISFNKHDSSKNSLRNFNREDIIYQRPKSSSKFKKTYKICNYSNDFNYNNKNF